MDDTQLAELTGLILEEYYFLKMADFKIWGNGFKKGKYLDFSKGKLFDRLDGQIIMLSIREYCEQRQIEAESIQREDYGTIKALEKGKEPMYYVQVGDKYMRDNGERVVEEVQDKEMATAFNWVDAKEVKSIVPGSKIVNVEKVGSLLDWFRKEKPDLAKEMEEHGSKPVKKLDDVRERILLDTSLSELERENKLRDLVGLVPLTQQELDFRNNRDKANQ